MAGGADAGGVASAGAIVAGISRDGDGDDDDEGGEERAAEESLKGHPEGAVDLAGPEPAAERKHGEGGKPEEDDDANKRDGAHEGGYYATRSAGFTSRRGLGRRRRCEGREEDGQRNSRTNARRPEDSHERLQSEQCREPIHRPTRRARVG